MNHTKRLFSVAVALVAVLALAFASSGVPTRAQVEPIPIGIAVAQTSDTALLGQEQVVGAQIAEKYFNDKGGVNGRPIKLVFQDAAGAPETAVAAFNTLISQNVVAIVGPTLSTQARAANPVANTAGVPILAPSNTAAGIPQIGQYVTRVSAPVAAYAANAISYAIELNKDLKNVAVLYAQDDVFSTSETQVFQKGAKDLGLTVTTVQTFSVKDKDFTTVIGAALDTKPDLVIISGLAVDGGNLVKQLRELDYKGLIIGGNGLNTANMFPVCQDKCDGVLVAQAYGPRYDSPENKDFVAAYTAQTKRETPPQFAAQAFTCVQIVVEALTNLEKKGSKIDLTDLAGLRKALNDEIQAGTYVTPLGKLSFTKVKNDKGEIAGGEVNQRVFGVAQIKMNADGKTGAFDPVKAIILPDTPAAAATMSATMAPTMAATAAK
jgi:branched-chain amino acid transport system substrate-binding protein